ncbi:hypothetical protein V6N13_111064 [Hibiscus sabdariffa]
MLVCLLGRLVLLSKNSVGLSPKGLVRFGCVRWWHRRRGRRKGGGVYVYVSSTGCEVGASDDNRVDVVKYWNAAAACSEAMEFSIIASKRSTSVCRRGEGRKFVLWKRYQWLYLTPHTVTRKLCEMAFRRSMRKRKQPLLSDYVLTQLERRERIVVTITMIGWTEPWSTVRFFIDGLMR